MNKTNFGYNKEIVLVVVVVTVVVVIRKYVYDALCETFIPR